MADAIVSAVAQRLTDTAVDLVRNEVKLLRGVEKEIADLSYQLKTVRTVLDDAERKGFKEESIRNWLKKLEATCYEMDDVLDEWDYTLLKQQMEKSKDASSASKHQVCSFIPAPSSCLCFKKVSSRHHLAHKIRQVKAKLDRILHDDVRSSFSTSQPTDPLDISWRGQSTPFVDVDDICGRHDDKKKLLSKFLDGEGTNQEPVRIISVVGAGGIGKTTLAQFIFNESRVCECYPLKFWICVSEPFDVAMIAKGILEKLRESFSNANQKSFLLELVQKSLGNRKFLLVLDDVWTEVLAEWEPLRDCLKSCGGAGSRILVTTRKEGVARMMDTKENDMHRVQVLSDEDCWSIMSRIAFFDRSEQERENLKEISKKIAISKCKGLPLAAKALGSLLRFRKTVEEWENVAKSEMWELEQKGIALFPHLALSYNELSPALKRCFSYCAVFPKDFDINVRFLVYTWAGAGYLGSDADVRELECRGREYVDVLAMRSLFQEFKMDQFDEHIIQSFKMHDIVHDFAQFIKKGTNDCEETCQICKSKLGLRVKEYRSLVCLEEEDEHPAYICECLTSLRVLMMKRSWPQGMEKLIHLRQLFLHQIETVAMEDLKAICKLYNLMILSLNECNLQQLPSEIGNLIKLRMLGLDGNDELRELPDNTCDLRELHCLGIEGCHRLVGLPQGINKLTKLEHLHISGEFYEREDFPDAAVGQLIGLRVLSGFGGKLGHLKKLNQLRGELKLYIRELGESEDDVREAGGAEMKNKKHIQKLTMKFVNNDEEDNNVEKEEAWMGVLNALEPHRNLGRLEIGEYGGSRLPNWITSPLNQVREIRLRNFDKLGYLPCMGKLPCLKELET